ncbi:MAG TPA: S-adenosylmethionine:tRNA ribosyltransferase-isomerase [Acidimicrobiales bacterium]|nr:S-adenosylmethionine:tRNA ribosyltransferase-isomerase [Acidimicrobiales bacterium]
MRAGTVVAATGRFALGEDQIAREPAEMRGRGRDDVRMMVAYRASEAVEHRTFRELPDVLGPGDLLVVNTSATVPAALPAVGPSGDELRFHLSTRMPAGGLWAAELRRPDGAGSTRYRDGSVGSRLALPGGEGAELLAPLTEASRLWIVRLSVPEAAVGAYLARHGRPVRYSHAAGEWPLAAYQSVFSRDPGSAEMPSAARPFTAEMVTRLVTEGVEVAPITLHTGVSSLESGEPPYPEWYRVPVDTARRVNSARAAGGRVVAVGTTAVRALESAVDRVGTVHPAEGWTEVVVEPARGVRAVDGLLTGWHEPESTHLDMLDAVGGSELVERSYRAALRSGYLWHEFGDVHLLLP